jgi:hypothetical protein
MKAILVLLDTGWRRLLRRLGAARLVRKGSKFGALHLHTGRQRLRFA